MKSCNRSRRSGRPTCDWSGLPMDLQFEIMDKLTMVDDYVRFGAVCVSWRTVFLQKSLKNKKQHCSQPFLLVASPDVGKHRFAMYSLSRKKFYDFDPHLQLEDNNNNNYIWGSCFGWLITSEIKGDEKLNVRLQNPFLPSERSIYLPHMHHMISRHPKFEEIRKSPNTTSSWKAVLSSDPLLSDEFALVITMTQLNGLALFNSGNGDWSFHGYPELDGTHMDMPHRWLMEHEDVIFSEKAKQFYVLRRSGQVLALDLHGGAEPVLSKFMQPAPPQLRNSYRHTGVLWMYLVEDTSSGELLQVHKFYKRIDIWEDRTIYFDILKLDVVEEKWIQIHDLGDKVMFLGVNASVMCSARECPGCKPNCVYFTDHLHCNYLSMYNDDVCGVYSLEEDKVLQLMSTDPRSGKKMYPCIWINPSLV